MRLMIIAEKLWDEFRSMNGYRGTCRKTFGELSGPHQNLWVRIAKTAARECQSNKHRKKHRKEK